MLNTRTAASTIGHGPLVTIPPDATLRDAAGRLHADTIGALAVPGSTGWPACSPSAISWTRSPRRVDLDVARVADHLSRPVMSARPDDTVLDVALQMLDAGTRHLPLVDDLDRPQAMVSLRDLLRPLVLQAMTPAEGGRGLTGGPQSARASSASMTDEVAVVDRRPRAPVAAAVGEEAVADDGRDGDDRGAGQGGHAHAVDEGLLGGLDERGAVGSEVLGDAERTDEAGLGRGLVGPGEPARRRRRSSSV